MKKAFEVKLNYLNEIPVTDEETKVPKDFTVNLSELKYKLAPTIATAGTFITDNLFYDPSKDQRYRYNNQKKIGRRFVGEYLVCLATIENVNTKPLLNIKLSLSYDKMKANSQVKDSYSLIDIDVQVMEAGQSIVLPFGLFLEDASYQ